MCLFCKIITHSVNSFNSEDRICSDVSKKSVNFTGMLDMIMYTSFCVDAINIPYSLKKHNLKIQEVTQLSTLQPDFQRLKQLRKLLSIISV